MGKARNWSKEELDTLQEEWGRYSITTQAKRLNRSVNAVLIKVQRLGLGRIAVNSDKSNDHNYKLKGIKNSIQITRVKE